jgi:hypothetical protein
MTKTMHSGGSQHSQKIPAVHGLGITDVKQELKTHRIPFGHHSLFLESGEFSSIVDGCEEFPQKKHCHTNKYDSGNDTEDNTK